MFKKVSEVPLIVICGETGTGKSRLAIEIAEHYGGEIINADALQVYGGMNIATNKVSTAELRRVPHHLLGCENVARLDYTIHDFQKAALSKINQLKNELKIPVVVGGTNYYLESILWHKLVDVNGNSLEVEKFNSMNNIELYEYLQSVDPESASLLHPNNQRKVLRAIEIYVNSSKSQHNHLKNQTLSRRFPLNETIFLWVNSEIESLFPRLENRVEEMINDGLLKELEEMQELFLQLPSPQTYTKGVFQAIGFKEFHDYLIYENKESEYGKQILYECIERLKLANKQYVKSQRKWIKNRFLRDSGDERNIPLFKVDSSDVTKWQDKVFQKSIDIIEEVRNCENMNKYSDFVKQLTFTPETLSQTNTFTPCFKICEICDNQIFISEESWNAHITAKRHEKRKRSERKRKANIEKIHVTE